LSGDVASGATLAPVQFNADGLVPVVVQEAANGQVLMLAWANAEAVQLTLDTGTATFYSRSRSEIWVKGATSGNTQSVCEVRLDCDGDALLYVVHAAGPACHTGLTSCFDTALLLGDSREQLSTLATKDEAN
jgi:phosphoribosyl-AMP cyclohydrolase